MAKIYQDNALSIGNTPLVKLNRVVGGHQKVYAKIEGRNPAYSVKCRIGASLIWDAENRGVLKAGMEIVEPTSGNTGIALAMAAAIKGYNMILIMPDHMSQERKDAIAKLGNRPEITRFKGLGEISPSEFELFIGKDIRLDPIILSKDQSIRSLLEYYMGKNTMTRQQHIIQNLKVEVDLIKQENSAIES